MSRLDSSQYRGTTADLQVHFEYFTVLHGKFPTEGCICCALRTCRRGCRGWSGSDPMREYYPRECSPSSIVWNGSKKSRIARMKEGEKGGGDGEPQV
jgi:hypothetical protein